MFLWVVCSVLVQTKGHDELVEAVAFGWRTHLGGRLTAPMGLLLRWVRGCFCVIVLDGQHASLSSLLPACLDPRRAPSGCLLISGSLRCSRLACGHALVFFVSVSTLHREVFWAPLPVWQWLLSSALRSGLASLSQCLRALRACHCASRKLV